MADVMEERIRSLQRCAGWCFVLGSILVGIAILVFPSFPEVNRTNLVLSKMLEHGMITDEEYKNANWTRSGSIPRSWNVRKDSGKLGRALGAA